MPDRCPTLQRLRRPVAALLLLPLALTLTLTPVPALSQADRLPDLGSAGGAELSPSAERRLGEAIMGQARAQGLVFDDAELAEFLNRFGNRLATTVPARGHPIEFFAVRDTSINAFALPGGFIGVHTGLIAVAQSESELATVLAHEIGHVTQRHIARMLGEQRQMSAMMLASILLGVLAAGAGGGGNAVMGALALGDTLALRQMMSYSRDAEREADRVGLDMLREAQFDVRAAPRFFDRLQQANRYNEGNYPAYLRSHPITSERMTDLSLRIEGMRNLSLSDSLDFRLIRARARAIGSPSIDALREARREFEQQLKGDGGKDPAIWFGLANVATEERAWNDAREKLARTRALLGSPHPFLSRLEIAIALGEGDVKQALETSSAALERYPDRLAILRLRGAALLAGRQFQDAVNLLRDRVNNDFRGDNELWRMLAEAYQGLDQPGLAHRAAAEGYLLNGQRLAAIQQLRAAQRDGDLDYYTGSIVESKLREQERLYQEELKDQRR